MAINIVSSLDSGNIASLLEVFAIFIGLLIAANLQSIVSLTARRRLYSRGTARLSDSTWNVGVLQGVSNPSRLLRDIRACLAFLISLVVICLEVLTVMQTRASRSCAFGESSTWRIDESEQKCFKANPEIESSASYYASSFVHSAQETARDIDLDVGIPVGTDIFEDSIVSGKAVQKLKEGGYAKLYTAPVVAVFDITGDVIIGDGLPFSPITVRTGAEAYAPYTELRCALEARSIGAGEENSWFPRNPEFAHFDTNGSVVVTAATGFFDVQPCLEDVVFRVCDYVGGRQEFPASPVLDTVEETGNESAGGQESSEIAEEQMTSEDARDGASLEGGGDEASSDDAGGGASFEGAEDGENSEGAGDGSSSQGTGDGAASKGAVDEQVFVADDGESFSVPNFLRQAIAVGPSELIGSVKSFEVQCKIRVISREGRRTDSGSIFVALYGVAISETIDISAVRRAVLVSLIAQNSASNGSCRRYVAAPKECTQIGWVSSGAVLLLMGLFVLTSFVRLWLKLTSRGQANINGSPQRLAVAIFNYFEGPDRRSFTVPGKRRKRDHLLGPRAHEEDIHMSVVKGNSERDAYRLVWTRGPLPEGATPSAHIPSHEISLQAEEGEEVMLI